MHKFGLDKLVTILRMIKFSHSVFALPFAVMAAFLVGRDGEPGFCGWGKLGLIVVCMVAARSVAITYNRIVDARLDARNPRTAGRAIPAGQVTARKAWWFLYGASLVFGMGTFLFWVGYGNYWPGALAFPVLLFICFYSLTKRFTWASHFWLGASLMLAPVGVCVAVSPPEGPVFTLPVMVLGGVVLLWTAGFDIIYAFQDIEVDRRDGLYSIPARLGEPLALWISRTCHSLAVTLLLLLAMIVPLGRIYLAAVGLAALLLLAEHILVRGGETRHMKIAFGTINGLVSILLAAATILDIVIT